MSFEDLLCFSDATGIAAVSKELEGYLLFPRTWKETCSFSKKLDGYLLFSRRKRETYSVSTELQEGLMFPRR
jgi:hypothetical protein